MRSLVTILLCFFLSACAKGPESSFQLAHQGFLSADISRDGSLALIGSIHHGGSLWDIERNERLFSWNHQAGEFSSFRTVALSGDGKVAVTTEEKSIGVWSTDSGKSLGFWEAADRVLSVDLNYDGSQAMIGMRDGALNLFELRRGQILKELKHEADVRTVAISDEAQTAISGSDDFEAIIWNLNTGKPQHSIRLNNQVKQVALSSSGAFAFVSAQRDGGQIIDVKTNTLVSEIHSRYTNYSSAEFSDDETILILGTSAGDIEQYERDSGERLVRWTAKPRKTFGGASSKAIVAVQGSPNTKALSADGMVQVFKQ